MLSDSAVPFHPVVEWNDRFPWLMAGVTHSGAPDDPFDLRLFGDSPPPEARERWRALLEATGFGSIAHAPQSHETRVVVHADLPPGMHVESAPADGHVTSTAGVLLAVTVADCVPVYLVDVEQGVVALLHAGWRGIARGILNRGFETLRAGFGTEPRHLEMHLGPAVCGSCYEVGPEVFAALGLPTPSGTAPVDIRAALVARARAFGLRGSRITVSEECTRCGSAGLFSHRGGRPERQAALLGIRP